jgi:hypothetical protein
MTRTARGIMMMLFAAGLLASPPGFGREASSHVLADAVTGAIKPAKITVQSAPRAPPITKTLPFFSSGPLMAAAAALRLGPESSSENKAEENVNALSAGTGQTKNCLSEFGGIAFRSGEDRHEKDGWGYTHAQSIDEYKQLTCAVIEAARTTGMFSGFCYTQFADTFQEVNGLLRADRTPKFPLERIRAAVCG